MAEDAPRQPDNKLEKEAIDRLREARRWKESTRVLDFKEAYFFAAPWRQREISSLTQPSQAPMLDQPELYTDIPAILCGDCVTEIINTYMPEAQLWCERAKGTGVPQQAWDQVKDDVKAADREIFASIKASNLYAELPKACNPDLLIAGAGLWIDRPHPALPVEVRTVPMREMEINLGPGGEIDDRFIVRYPYNKYVQTLIGETAWNKVKDEIRKVIEDKPTDRTQVTWGFWRKWNKLPNEVWQHVILLDNELVHEAEISGEGCCPYVVMRFGATADWPWAHGPMLQHLPTLRQIDEWERQIPEAVERSVNSPFTYPDDSFVEVEQGLEPGMGYPVRQGGAAEVKRIYDQPTIDPALGDLERKEKRLRKGFYVDYPEQTGDTPPTLGQWLDEMARAQRRIGTPGQSFWREGPRAIFLRFKYLEEQGGHIKAVTDKDGRGISTQPYNPAQRAAEQQEIATATQCAQILAQMFPEEWRLAIDGRMTMEAFVDKMRTQGLLKFRDKNQVAAALQQIAQLTTARHEPGAPTAPGAGAPAAA